MTRKTQTKNTILLQPDRSSALIHMGLSFRVGAIYDPPSKAGLASITTSMLLRGTKKKSYQRFHEKLDELGSKLYLDVNKESIDILGITLSQNLDAFLALFREAILEPAFLPKELKKVLQQRKSMLQDELDTDGDIAARRFQEYFLHGHPYGRSTSGSLESLEQITAADVRTFYKKCSSRIAIFAATGDFERKQMHAIGTKLLNDLPSLAVDSIQVPTPDWNKGVQTLFLEKPGCTQSQIYMGTPGIAYSSPHYHATTIASHIFGGGCFQARLMKEIREKRGWSYGAYAYFRSARKPLYYAMHTTPSNENTSGAVQLMLKLYNDFVRKGVTKEEFLFAKKSIYNQSAFIQDTLQKKLSNSVAENILELPKGFYANYQKNISMMTHKKVQAAIQAQWRNKSLFIMVLGSGALWKADLEKIKAMGRVSSHTYDASPSLL